MKYVSVEEMAKAWEISPRSVRNYCAQGRIADAVLQGKTWMIPAAAVKPKRKSRFDQIPQSVARGVRRRCEWTGRLGGGGIVI